MASFARFTGGVVVAWLALAGLAAAAENEGQGDLDKAIQAKLNANTLSDLSEVIRLIEGALKKGLSKDNVDFANNLLASALAQRGEVTAKTVFKSGTPDPKWAEFRKLALDDLERSIKLNPNQPQPLLYVAQLNLLPGGDAKRAVSALDEAIRTSGEEPKLKTRALLLRAALRVEPEKKLADLDEAVRIAPQEPAVWRGRGRLLADLEKLEPALADLKKAIELDADHAPTYEAQAMVLARLKKYDEALVALDKAQHLEPEALSPLVQKARIHAERKNLKAALHEMDQAYKLDPGNPAVLLLRATVYQELGEKDKALADVDQALRLEPDLGSAARLRAQILAEAGKLDQAVAGMERFAKAHPKDLAGRLQLASLYAMQKKNAKAIEIYGAILAEKPDQWMALRARADTLLNIGKHAEAIADYEKALAQQTDDSGILNNLAWVLATSPDDKIRDGKRAIKLATKACELTDYKLPHILSTLAAAYAETGDFQTARKWSQKAVDIGDKQHQDSLKKELESYKANKPWREVLSEGEPKP